MAAYNAIIHKFDAASDTFDEEGDPMIGCYYQFIDENDQPVGDMVGPYLYRQLAEGAAKRAFVTKDF